VGQGNELEFAKGRLNLLDFKISQKSSKWPGHEEAQLSCV
jgi:hypothetical protein